MVNLEGKVRTIIGKVFLGKRCSLKCRPPSILRASGKWVNVHNCDSVALVSDNAEAVSQKNPTLSSRTLIRW